jgi:hypothetical protein
MTPRTVLVTLALVLGNSCTPHQPEPSVARRDWRKAELDGAGDVVALRVVERTETRQIIATGDYGMLVVWGDDEKAFYLFDRRNKTSFATRTFKDFLREVRQLPLDITMTWIDTCTASRSWNMPDSDRKELADVLLERRRLGMKWSESPLVVCYCESRGLQFLPVK